MGAIQRRSRVPKELGRVVSSRRWSWRSVVGVASRWRASLWRRAVEAIGGSTDGANVSKGPSATRGSILGIRGRTLPCQSVGEAVQVRPEPWVTSMACMSTTKPISAEFPFPSHYVEVHGSRNRRGAGWVVPGTALMIAAQGPRARAESCGKDVVTLRVVPALPGRSGRFRLPTPSAPAPPWDRTAFRRHAPRSPRPQSACAPHDRADR